MADQCTLRQNVGLENMNMTSNYDVTKTSMNVTSNYDVTKKRLPNTNGTTRD